MQIDWKRVQTLIQLAIEEDLGSGDATSLSIIPPDSETKAILICNEECVCAGLPVAEKVFKKLNKNIIFTPLVKEGQLCKKKTILAKIAGKAIPILSAERTALNFLQRLCGIATVSHRYAMAVKGTKTKILDTRKTTPGWRNLEKYAVAVGGSSNHRIGLYDRIMIKDNHRTLASALYKCAIKDAVMKARKKFPQLEVEVEADTLKDVKDAVDAKADYILLDNMDINTIKKAVKIINGKAKIEVSGGITFSKLAKIAKTGVDFISCGALTHSVKAIDISMELQ
ncbi:MAG TPA: carboxylating nicotinate-nucleotide diphosphorylase [Victivallales bacterium]|nr:carboxylating nicotinate-nucleotide diphosphorylase [Victivallales bacterium]HPO90420.1 carboxylating nicotinate-nucleotide diphosphorylase [Victivallales bacterium]HRR27888.1 carboxylating nicotinate-nucleotide diphosphorylase [Victivallales bacterium]HRU00796.1 carboxylating nicotinate-nucleotide diphosphorylase [Victivallales bacterium]